jgi:hypothetical protein
MVGYSQNSTNIPHFSQPESSGFWLGKFGFIEREVKNYGFCRVGILWGLYLTPIGLYCNPCLITPPLHARGDEHREG